MFRYYRNPLKAIATLAKSRVLTATANSIYININIYTYITYMHIYIYIYVSLLSQPLEGNCDPRKVARADRNQQQCHQCRNPRGHSRQPSAP